MRVTTLLLILATLLAPVATMAAPDFANGLLHRDRNGKVDRDLLNQPRRATTTLDQAVNRVRRDTGGRILSAETLSVGGDRVHRIKVLTPDNRVRIIRVDAGR